MAGIAEEPVEGAHRGRELPVCPQPMKDLDEARVQDSRRVPSAASSRSAESLLLSMILTPILAAPRYRHNSVKRYDLEDLFILRGALCSCTNSHPGRHAATAVTSRNTFPRMAILGPMQRRLRLRLLGPGSRALPSAGMTELHDTWDHLLEARHCTPLPMAALPWGEGKGEGRPLAPELVSAPHPNPLPASGERGKTPMSSRRQRPRGGDRGSGARQHHGSSVC